MALLTKKEFAASCACSTRELSVYIRRKKVEVGSDGLIDDRNPNNMAFCKYRQSLKPKPVGVVSAPEPRSPTKVEAKAKPVKQRPEHEVGLFELDLKRKQIDLDYKRTEHQLKEIEIDKKTGKLIPTDLVRAMFTEYARSLTMEMHQMLENHLLEISKRAKMRDEDLAIMRGVLIKEINTAVDRAVTESQKNISAIVAEYSQVRAGATI